MGDVPCPWALPSTASLQASLPDGLNCPTLGNSESVPSWAAQLWCRGQQDSTQALVCADLAGTPALPWPQGLTTSQCSAPAPEWWCGEQDHQHEITTEATVTEL